MKCSECQKEIPEGSVFCPVCGSAQFGEPAEVTSQPVAEVQEEPTLVTEETPPAKKKKKWWILTAAAGVLAVVVALGILASHQPGVVVYTTYNDLFLYDISNGERVKLAEQFNTRSFAVTENQRHLFYMAEANENWPNDLYHLDLRSRSKEPEKLAENVEQFYVNARGTRLCYIRNGSLYVHNLKGETFIADDVDYYFCDEDIDTFAFSRMTKVGDAFDLTRKWYFMNGNSNPQMVGEDGLVDALRLTADGKRLIYADDGGLYAWENNKEIVIAENAKLAGGVYEDGTFYYHRVNDGDQTAVFFYDGKRSVEIPVNGSVKMGNSSRPMLMWQDEQSGQYYVAVGERVLEIPLEQVTDVKLSGDGKTLCVITQEGEGRKNSDLYAVDISWGKVGEARLLARDAMGFRIYSVGKHLYYWIDEIGETGDLYCDGKLVVEDVQNDFNVHEGTGNILVLGEASPDGLAAVYMVRGDKVIKLADESKQVMFATNGDPLVRTEKSELWCFDNTGAGKCLAKFISELFCPKIPRRPSSLYLWDFDFT